MKIHPLRDRNTEKPGQKATYLFKKKREREKTPLPVTAAVTEESSLREQRQNKALGKTETHAAFLKHRVESRSRAGRRCLTHAPVYRSSMFAFDHGASHKVTLWKFI